jgi:methionine biosynthesis protein MetW
MTQDTYVFSKDHYQPGDDHYRDISDKVKIKKILNLIGNDKIVLDCGCFDGQISEKIKNNGNTVYGMDASEEAVKSAVKRGIIAVTANIESQFPYEDNKFDIVLAGEVFEHILDTDALVKEISRVLKNNGSLIVTTPNTASLGRRLMLLFGKNAYFEASFSCPHNAVGHIRFFTKKLLSNFLKKNNFVIDSFTTDVIKISIYRGLVKLGNLFPTLGHSLIIKATIKKDLPLNK